MIGRERDRDAVSTKYSARITAVGDYDLLRRHYSYNGSRSNGVALRSLEVTPTAATPRATQILHLLVHPIKAPLHRALPFHSFSFAFHLFLHYIMQPIPTLGRNLEKKWNFLDPKINDSVKERTRDASIYMRATMPIKHTEEMKSV